MKTLKFIFTLTLIMVTTLTHAQTATQSINVAELQKQYGLTIAYPLSAPASADYNTGAVYVGLLKNSSTSMIANFLFTPGSRNFWHLHPDAEQTLMILEGEAYYQEEGQPKRLLRKGDYVVTPANAKHWNGATEKGACVCLTVTELTDKPHANQLRAVTDEEYLAGVSASDHLSVQTDPELYAMMQRAYGVDVRNIGQLDLKTREMVSCVALTALGTTSQVAAHARAALDAGVTPVELREAIYLVAPFAGFPKVLDAMEVVNRLFIERGITLPLPDQGTTTPATRHQVGHDIQWQLYEGGIARAMKGLPGEMGQQMADLLTDVCFGDIYSRDGLSLQMHELLTYVVLTVLQAPSQLHSHFLGCLKAGNTPETVVAAVINCMPHIGFPATINTLRIIIEVMESNKE